MTDRLDELGPAAFEPHRGTEFELELDDQPRAMLRLDEVTAYRQHPGTPRAEPFALVFSGSPPMLEQRTYRLGHPAFGGFDIFLVPIGLDADGRVRYEAVFN